MPDSYPKIEADGTVRFSPEISVPFSDLASAEARVAAGRRWQGYPADFFDGGNPFGRDRVLATRKWFDEAARQGTEAMRALYPVEERQDTVDGVPIDVVTPREVVPSSNQNLVLINLHGGGFVFGARWVGLTESIPIASLGKIKVVTVDYRMGPEHLFPAASEDVAKGLRARCLTRVPARTHRPLWLLRRRLPGHAGARLVPGARAAPAGRHRRVLRRRPDPRKRRRRLHLEPAHRPSDAADERVDLSAAQGAFQG